MTEDTGHESACPLAASERDREALANAVLAIIEKRLYERIGRWAVKRVITVGGAVAGFAWLALEIAARLKG